MLSYWSSLVFYRLNDQASKRAMYRHQGSRGSVPYKHVYQADVAFCFIYVFLIQLKTCFWNGQKNRKLYSYVVIYTLSLYLCLSLSLSLSLASPIAQSVSPVLSLVRPVFLPRIDDSHLDRIHSSLIADHCGKAASSLKGVLCGVLVKRTPGKHG